MENQNTQINEMCNPYRNDLGRVINYIKERNIPLRGNKIYSYDETFFEIINTEEKAYWLGFLYADGMVRVRKTGSGIRLKLGVKDLSHIEKFKEVINSTHKITFRPQKGVGGACYEFSIYSNKLAKDLINKGCKPNKSLILTFPEFLSKELLHHFIRGYFDGDGCVSYGFYKRKNRNKKSFVFMTRFISSSRRFLEDISKKLNIYATMRFGCISKHTGAYNLSYSKNDTIKLFNYMYKNSKNGLFLERKFAKFQEIFKILGINTLKN